MHPWISQPAYIFCPIPRTLYFTLHIIRLSGQPKACRVQERIHRIIRLKLGLPTLLVLRLLARDRKGPGGAIHLSIPVVIPNLCIPYIIPNLSIPLLVPNLRIPYLVPNQSIPLAVPNQSIPLVVLTPSIPLVLQMANLRTKGNTILNSLPVRYPI